MIIDFFVYPVVSAQTTKYWYTHHPNGIVTKDIYAEAHTMLGLKALLLEIMITHKFASHGLCDY